MFTACLYFLAIIIVVVALALPHVSDNAMMKGSMPFIAKSPYGFSHADIPDMSGKLVLVTGANAGLGFSSAKFMALKGATTVLGCRSMDKCQAACEAIRAIDPAADVVPAVMDLGSLASVQKFVSFFKKQFAHRSLDVLMLNAGVMNTYPFQLTEDGIEYQFGVNHVAHFYLTKSLFDMLSMNEARIVVVSSNTMWHTYDYGVSLRLAKGINNVEKYDPLLAYGQSKLANVLFAQELQDRVKNTNIYVNALNPGGVVTELWAKTIEKYVGRSAIQVMMYFSSFILWDPDTASLTQLYAATSPEIVTKNIKGKYFAPIARLNVPCDFARNATLQKKLWTFTEEILKDKGFFYVERAQGTVIPELKK